MQVYLKSLPLFYLDYLEHLNRAIRQESGK